MTTPGLYAYQLTVPSSPDVTGVKTSCPDPTETVKVQAAPKVVTQVSAASVELPVVEGSPTQVAAAASAAPAAAPPPAAGVPAGLPATGGDETRDSALGAALWALPIILLGYLLKEVLASLLRALQDSRVSVTLLIIAVVAIYLVWRYVRRQQAMRIKGVPRIESMCEVCPARLNKKSWPCTR